MTMLTVENLCVWFGGGRDRVDAVRQASFNVERGASFGLVGESGSGKSTILRAIMGLAPNWSGAISVDDQPVTKKREKAFYKTVQMVFQDPYASLHPRHSVDQVLGETLHLHGFRDIDARVVKLLDDVGLGGKFRFRYPHQLSGGQRQRVAIAVSVQAEILNLLTDLRSEQKLTYVMVSHDLSVVGHMCEQLAVMKDGEIVEIMDVETLRTAQARHAYSQELLAASI